MECGALSDQTLQLRWMAQHFPPAGWGLFYQDLLLPFFDCLFFLAVKCGPTLALDLFPWSQNTHQKYLSLCVMEAELIFYLPLLGRIVFYNWDWAGRNMAQDWGKSSYSACRVNGGYRSEKGLWVEHAPI